MVRRNLKVAACAFIVGILFALSATVVFAATATSPWGYYGPFLDYYYKNQASVTSDYPPGVYAITKAAQDGTSNVPTGYMGVKARLYKSDALVASTDWRYNSVPANEIQTGTQNITGSGTYYSKGLPVLSGVFLF